MIRMKNKLFCLVIALILFIPISVKAENRLILDCPKKVNSNSNVTCTLSGYSDSNVSSLSTKLNLSNNLEFVSFTTNSIWQGGMNNGKIDVYTDNNKINQFTIGTVNIKVNESADSSKDESLLTSGSVFYDDNFDDLIVKETSSTIAINSTDNYLYSLSVSGYSLNPSFKMDVMEYNLTVKDSEITVNAIANSSKATVSGSGKKTLSVGNNKISISVKSEAGTVRNYVINVIRENVNINDNNNNSNSSNNSDTKRNVMNPNATGKILSDNNNIKKLEVIGYKLDFKADVLEYNIDVDSDVEKIEVKAEAEDSKAKVVIDGNSKLNYGKNVVVIQVTSESNKLKEYRVIVNRKAASTCLLSSLKINGYKLDFDKTTFVYNLAIGDEDSLDINAVAENSNSVVKIIDNENLINGSVIKIKVSNGDEEAVYNIYIKKNMSIVTDGVNDNNSNNYLLFIIFGLLLVAIIIFIIVLLRKRNKNYKDNDDINDNLENDKEVDDLVVKEPVVIDLNTDINNQLEQVDDNILVNNVNNQSDVDLDDNQKVGNIDLNQSVNIEDQKPINLNDLIDGQDNSDK